MEEMLGWFSPSDSVSETVVSPPLSSQDSFQETTKEIKQPPLVEEEPEAAPDQEMAAPLVEPRVEMDESESPLTSFSPDHTPDPAPVDQTAINESIKEQVRESVEKVTWEVLPELLRSALSKEAMTPIIEKIAWEVVAPIAESEIKKEIKRLQVEEE